MVQAERTSRPAEDPTWRSGQVRFGFLAITAALVCLLDQVTKYLIYTSIGPGSMEPGQEVAVVPGLVYLNYVQNRGVAFGMLKQFGDVFIPLQIVIMTAVFIYYYSLRGPHLLLRAALSLEIGGAIGNFLDRLRFGYVIDFVDFRVFPVFNVADSAIFLGATTLVLIILFQPES